MRMIVSMDFHCLLIRGSKVSRCHRKTGSLGESERVNIQLFFESNYEDGNEKRIEF